MARKCEQVEAENTWNETRNFWPDDIALRAAGFEIAHRPPGHEPLWRRKGDRTGRVFTAAEAALESGAALDERL